MKNLLTGKLLMQNVINWKNLVTLANTSILLTAVTNWPHSKLVCDCISSIVLLSTLNGTQRLDTRNYR